jgi:hypothetical protein
MSIGLFLGISAQKHLEEINKTRATMGLKPMAVHEFLQNIPKETGILNAEGKLNQKIIKHFAQEANVEAKAAKAALKSFPKGTFSGIVDDVAAKLAAPAAAAAVGLETVRRRRNKNAAKELAAEAKATAAEGASKLGLPAARNMALDLAGISKGSIGIGAGIGAGIGIYNTLEQADLNWQERNPKQSVTPETYIDPMGERQPLVGNQRYNESDMYADMFRQKMDSQYWNDIGNNIGPNVMSGVRGAFGDPQNMMQEGRTWITNKALGYTPEEIGSNKFLTGINALESIPEAGIEGLYGLGKSAIGALSDLGKYLGDLPAQTPPRQTRTQKINEEWKDK